MLKNIFFTILIFSLLSVNPARSQHSETDAPCSGEQYTQFDFWIGDWVVYVSGQMVGFNKIIKIEDDCLLRENWKSVVSSHKGTSYNFYDKQLKKWRHIWIDNQGSTLDLTGEYHNKKMILRSNEILDEKGNRIFNRMTWHENADGTVRQVWEQSKDGGQTFTILFDGLYRKRKSPNP
ncbi:MAG: hypothetical protein M0P69_02360 [Bacteroidales bacterium]|jgi:hypothetical protein|nr:hypothetical protein [Bacteroidales bacterium]MDD2811858.1 hypothetical protein [Bacteroidales bacterium]MDD3810813.1 hypothetical protein [Bacteroidales bacterium]MDD3870795.1 hypothetical protein [Bacteroidales bacterium]